MYEIGDRVYYRIWDGHIASSIITNIEARHGVIDVNGTEADYFMYDTTAGGAIESYNCLPIDDPDVQEYIGWHGGEQSMNIKEEIAKLLYEKGYISEPDDISVKGFFINLYDIDEVDPVYGDTADY